MVGPGLAFPCLVIGLGYAIVKKFHEHGATVFALDKNKKSLEALKEEFRNVTTICVDLRDWDETRRLVKSVAPIDHLVNNAAITQTSYFDEIAAEQIDECVLSSYDDMRVKVRMIINLLFYLQVV